MMWASLLLGPSLPFSLYLELNCFSEAEASCVHDHVQDNNNNNNNIIDLYCAIINIKFSAAHYNV